MEEKWTVTDTENWAAEGLEAIRSIFEADGSLPWCAFILSTRDPNSLEPLAKPAVLHLRPKPICCDRAKGEFARCIAEAVRDVEAIAYIVTAEAWMVNIEGEATPESVLQALRAHSAGGLEGVSVEPAVTVLYQRTGVTRARSFSALINRETNALGAFTEQDCPTNLDRFAGLLPAVQ